jgi:DNA uptake protein ComE-like DNA-binding protein
MRKTYALALCLLILAPVALAQNAPPASAGGVVNVNTATPEQLQLLPRIGPALAGRIVEARPIADLAALDAVKGMGPAMLELLTPLVTFEGPTTLTEKVKAPSKTKPQQSENVK